MGEHISFFAQQLLIFHHQVGKILSREKEVRRIPADQDINLFSASSTSLISQVSARQQAVFDPPFPGDLPG